MENVIVEKSFKFAVKIIRLARDLRKNNHEYELASQLLRSGTSIGANVSESQYGQSDKDFSSKLHIALKETNETKYWLKLLTEAEVITPEASKPLLTEVEEIKRILIAILKSTNPIKQNNK